MLFSNRLIIHIQIKYRYLRTPNGEGVENIYPPLAESDYLMQKREESIRVIKYGHEGEFVVNGKTYNSNMDALGLSDDEVADRCNELYYK